eukprot:g78026.t1
MQTHKILRKAQKSRLVLEKILDGIESDEIEVLNPPKSLCLMVEFTVDSMMSSALKTLTLPIPCYCAATAATKLLIQLQKVIAESSQNMIIY